MNQDKMHLINKIFNNETIRTVWDSEQEKYYISVIDVIKALTNSDRPRKYWNDLKVKINLEGNEVSAKIGQLKLKSQDGKLRLTDVVDIEGMFRIIESVPSRNAEPIKEWLARLGSERVDESFDPSIGIDKMIDFYLFKGYSLEWIETRIKAIITRKKLTKTWKDNGIKKESEYAILTNEIYKTWSGMTAKEYKEYKGLRKESLRDNMSDIEVALTDLGELATKKLAEKHHPTGLIENKKIARLGGQTAKIARDDIEKKLGESIISDKNLLSYEYMDNNKKIGNQN